MKYSFSESIQNGILYLLKHDKEFYSQIVPLIKSEYFEFPSYQHIFTKIQAYYDKYRTIPSDAILLEDIKFTLPEGQDLSDYEDSLYSINNIDISTIENKEFILDLVESYARKMAVKEAIKASVGLLKEDRIDEIETLIREALLVTRNVDVGHEYFKDFGSRIKEFFKTKETDKFKTVFPTINNHLEGGLSRKELAYVVAPPGVGKSLYLVNQSVASLMESRNVLYISLEMSEGKISKRFDSITTLLSHKTLATPEGCLELQKRLSIFNNKYNTSRLVIKEFPTGQANVNHIRSLLVQLELHAQFKPDLLVIDYLELLRPVREIDSEWLAQQRISEELRGLGVEKNILVFTATQTNRLAKKVGIITDSELGDSYNKFRTTDFAISLNQTTEERDKNRMRVYVMKARDSKQHYIVPASINYENLKIEEIIDENKELECGA
jgi:replicative DNA helicase